MVNLKALRPEELQDFIVSCSLPPFRARQLIHRIYEKGAESIDDIKEFSKQLREQLSRKAYISNLKLLERQKASDGTEKFLFELEDRLSIETVLIPDDDRLTLCVSSQVGCAMGCDFCLTGTIGLKRNLRSFEIVDQVIQVSKFISYRRITNIVFMGMGEPLQNIEEVSDALLRITRLIGISKRRITLSTAGIVPNLLKLPEMAPSVNIAISLNATTDEVRNTIMPINRRYPIKMLLEACRAYPLEPRRRITFEYVLLRGVNDTIDDAKRLARMLRGIPSKVNLIPFNPYRGAKYKRPDEDRVLQFQEILVNSGITALIRKSKGAEICGACGQLAGHNEPNKPDRGTRWS
ncbi:MAG: 23S rRNA (adenine(2503)-C(2))-methyltransferase RlmN [Nitrospirae bacterium]|nr:23S rRNA (adenine(2503)-C(2))-methyltransferase RlmN [Nitrospirota bacterium]